MEAVVGGKCFLVRCAHLLQQEVVVGAAYVVFSEAGHVEQGEVDRQIFYGTERATQCRLNFCHSGSLGIIVAVGHRCGVEDEAGAGIEARGDGVFGSETHEP